MRDLLTDLYNKVINFFQSEKEVASKEIASNRLKLVLMQDRTNLDAGTIEKMRVELVDVISKYVEIDQEEFGVNLEGVGDSIALMLNIPVIRAKTPEEIEAALNAEKQEEVSSEEDAAEEENAEEETDSEEATEEETEEKEEETVSEEVEPVKAIVEENKTPTTTEKAKEEKPKKDKISE